MAMSVVYSNFCGMVVSETRNGVESDYVHDTLGSTIGLMDSAGTMTDRWEYWPFGEVLSRTGTNATPLTFLGVIGYFQDVLSTLYYVRARHLRADLARWLTADPLWPKQPAYEYSGNSPTTYTDPSGLWKPVGSGSASVTVPLSDLGAVFGVLAALALIGYTATITTQWNFSLCPSLCALGEVLGGVMVGGTLKGYVLLSAGKILDALIAQIPGVIAAMLCGLTGFVLTATPWVPYVLGVICSFITGFLIYLNGTAPEKICQRSDGTRCFYAKLSAQCCAVPVVTMGCC